jgi:hypothetical protein
MYYYIKVAANGTPLDHVSRETPFEGYETAESAGGTQPYYVEATLDKPPLGTGEKWEGPTYSLDPPTISYSIVAIPNPTVIPALDFFERFQKTERKAIRQAAKTNDDLEDWIDLLRVAGSVDLTSPRVIAGVEALVTAGLISEARKTTILTP